MHLRALRLKNFRRLKDVQIDLESDISIFVGSNNSGKTSTSQALQLFMSAFRDRFSIHDFSADCWEAIDAVGEQVAGAALPAISLDLWFHVEANDLHRVIDLLPSLSWQGSLVGMRVEFGVSSLPELIAHFTEARDRARASARPVEGEETPYYPPPRTLCDFLVDNLRKEFELRYYVLDRAKFDVAFVERAGYVPLQIKPDNGRGGRDVLNSILLVDFLGAQRHLSDSSGGSRAEDLSRCLSRFYERNLEQRDDDYDAIRALAEAESMLNEHLTRVFEPTLQRLGDLGYPGMTNPRLLIRSALNPTTIMSSQDGAHVHYALGDPQDGTEGRTLPDRYNGLGFKNLIYMVVELLHLHAQWMDIEENRPPLHLVFIEEPEAHLHAQLQQVFIRKVLDILEIDGEDRAHYANQLVVTTHSPHILYERGFRAIRYFRRAVTAEGQSSDVLNLSAFYAQTANPTRDFLERYLKLTHCDLFFADAAVLVEGNVERLLLPQMIGKVAPRLKSACLSVIEIGGAFGHRFRSLIEFLGITTLIVTDIDSVVGPPVDDAAPAVAANSTGVVAPVQPEEPDEDQPEGTGVGTACMVGVIGAVSANQTLVQWLPGKSTISDLLAATPGQRTQQRSNASKALIRVSYQMSSGASWSGETTAIAGRTLEEAFALENLVWCQAAERSDLKLRVRGAATLTVTEIAEQLHKKIKSTAFKKTDFALALLAEPSEAWTVPSYIAQGLQWLQDEIAPLLPDSSPAVADVVVP